MQHPGAPTRLLDWSRSPFVAVYFAARSGDTDGAVWAVQQSVVMGAMKEKHTETYERFSDLMVHHASIDDDADELKATLDDPANPSVIRFADTNFLTDRMERQQGLFTFCTQPHVDQAEAMSDVAPDDFFTEPLVKIIIRDDLAVAGKREFMARLQQMNITGFSLFPDLDGIGRYCEDAATYNLSPV